MSQNREARREARRREARRQKEEPKYDLALIGAKPEHVPPSELAVVLGAFPTVARLCEDLGVDPLKTEVLFKLPSGVQVGFAMQAPGTEAPEN